MRHTKLAAIGAALLAGTAAAAAGPTLTKVASFEHQITGVAVAADGRKFVNMPRWTVDTAISVAELMPDGSLRPYPDAEWNSYRNTRSSELTLKDHFVSVQSIVPDGHDHLWVVDTGAPGNDKPLPNGPKLVRIDLAGNRVGKVIVFPDTVALQGTSINDVRISPDGRTGYVSEHGTKSAIIVVDLESGKSWRALDGDPSTQADKTVIPVIDGKPVRRPDGRVMAGPIDGIALSNDGRTLYWQALTGRTLYAIDTALLRYGVSERARSQAVRTVASTQVADGLWMSRAGTLYLTSPTDHSIRRLNGSSTESVLTDHRLRWPDTLSEGPDGTIYVTDSHIPDGPWFRAGAPADVHTDLYAFKP